jgi:predicted dehydrogenase
VGRSAQAAGSAIEKHRTFLLDNQYRIFGFPRMHAYVDQLAVYTDAVLSRRPPPVTGEDGRAGVAAALALLESSHTGRVVSLR